MTEFQTKALRLLIGTSVMNVMPVKALASQLWPEKLAQCGTSRRRVALCRAAGAYYSKLMKLGLCSHHMDDFTSGYYILKEGKQALDVLQPSQLARTNK